MKNSAFAALVMLTAACSAPDTSAPAESLSSTGEPVPALTLVAPSTPWAQYRATAGSRAADIYVVHDSQPKPVVILFAGSGCTPEFTGEVDGTMHPTNVFQEAVKPSLPRAHFAVVERPGVDPLVFSAGLTHEEKRRQFARAERECTDEFYKTATKGIRVEDGLLAIRALRQQTFVQEIILAGHSEGTHVVTGILRQLKGREVAAAGLFASAGPVRWFCGYAGDGAHRDRFRAVFDRMRMLQQADDDFMWEGLPARRWKTFWLESTPIEDVRDSTVPLFVAQGERDDTTLCADLFTLEAIRQQPSRALRYVVVERGDHAFATTDGRWRAADLFRDFLGWAFDRNRSTSVGTLK